MTPSSQKILMSCFNTQPPEGGCRLIVALDTSYFLVSTHSRPKAAAFFIRLLGGITKVSTHSRPKAAAYSKAKNAGVDLVSTHSRPKAAA